jgi:hypothetical protein
VRSRASSTIAPASRATARVRHDRGIRSARLLPALDAQRRRRPSGDLILIDAGAEVDSLYTADITRTIPVSGTFSPSSA